MEIYPAIIAKDFEDLKGKIGLIEPYFSMVQLDVMDGKFVENITYGDPQGVKSIPTNLNWEIHLMVQEVEKAIDGWVEIEPMRIIFHCEAVRNLPIDRINDIILKIKNYGIGVGMAANPETPLKAVKPFLNNLDLVLLMTVRPGQGGQRFLNEVIPKIDALRKLWPSGKIEVDGGINSETAKLAIQAGANILVAGSYIFGTEDIKKVINELKYLTV